MNNNMTTTLSGTITIAEPLVAVFVNALNDGTSAVNTAIGTVMTRKLSKVVGHYVNIFELPFRCQHA